MQCRSILGHTMRCMMTQDPTLMNSFPLHSLRTRPTSLIQARWSTVQLSTMRYKGLAIQMLTSSSLVHIECMYLETQRPGPSHSIRNHIAWSMLTPALTPRSMCQQHIPGSWLKSSPLVLLNTDQMHRMRSMTKTGLRQMSSFQLHMVYMLMRKPKRLLLRSVLIHIRMSTPLPALKLMSSSPLSTPCRLRKRWQQAQLRTSQDDTGRCTQT